MIIPEPRLMVGDTTYTRLGRQRYEVAIESSDPTGLAYANRVGRFKEFRVGFAVELSTDEDEDSVDGGCSPNLALFEPLIPGTDHYYLPWFTPAGLQLEETALWDGWEGWLGSDNLQIRQNRLSILANDGQRMHVRWTGQLPEGEPFVYEGPLEIAPAVFYARESVDVPAMLERLFGAEQVQRVRFECTRDEPMNVCTLAPR